MVSPPKGHTSRITRRTLPRTQGPPRYSNASVRPKLLEAALDAAASRGYQALRITDITDPANVTRQAFYSHFRDKRHCLCEALDPRLAAVERMAGAPAEEPPGPLGEEWRSQILATVDDLLESHFGSSEGTKGRLIEALAAELGTTQSLAGIRIGHLVKRAHVPQGDFYRHFSGKRECFAVLYEQRLEAVLEEARSLGPDEPLQRDPERTLEALASAIASDRSRASLLVVGEGELPGPGVSTLGCRRGVLTESLANLLAEAGVSADGVFAGALVEVTRSAVVADELHELGDRFVRLARTVGLRPTAGSLEAVA